MKNQYQIKKKTRQAAETLLAFNGTEYQARRIASALSCVYTQTDAQALELYVVTAAGERCVAYWKYRGAVKYEH